jgi:hypothetical protein
MIAFDALTRLENVLINTAGIAEALALIALSPDTRVGPQAALCFLARALALEEQAGREAFNEVWEVMKTHGGKEPAP